MKNQQNFKFEGMTIGYLLSTALKGISQVILIENVVSGLIILIAITLADYHLGIVAFFSSIIGTIVARAGGADKNLIDQGLFGYNSVLAGLALFIFLTGYMRWVIALGGAALAVLITAAIMHLFKNLEIPVLTFPYILIAWLFLLTSYHLEAFRLSPELVPQDLTHWTLNTEGSLNIIQGLANGVGQVYFQSQFWISVLILIGVFWANWKLGIYTILGAGIGWLTAYSLGPESNLINLGLYGYNSILTLLAVSAVFDTDHPLAPVTGIVGAIITVPITAGVDTWLGPYGLPVLTMPFVLVTWILLGARKLLPKL